MTLIAISHSPNDDGWPNGAYGCEGLGSACIHPPEWCASVAISAAFSAVELPIVQLLEDIEAGEELCCVPRTACLDLSAVEGAGSPCEALVPTSLWARLRWYQRLSCWLLFGRAGSSSGSSNNKSGAPPPAEMNDDDARL